MMHILLECPNLEDIRCERWNVCSLRNLFENVENENNVTVLHQEGHSLKIDRVRFVRTIPE